MNKRYLTKAEHNAILAGLRLLQIRLHREGDAGPCQDILTDGIADKEVLNEFGIDSLCENISFDLVQFGPEAKTE